MEKSTKIFSTGKKREHEPRKGVLKVLAYHSVRDLKTFEKQLKFLKDHYNIISFSELYDFIELGERLPDNALLITFDDGDFSLYKNAFPVLKREAVPATIFVITELLNTNQPFWWDEIEFYLGEKKGADKVWEVKEWPNQKRLDYLRSLRENSIRAYPKYRQLTSGEVVEMNNSGITIANHSHSHPMFNQCSKSEIKKEIVKSTAILKSLGLESRAFAYPNGNYSIVAEKVLLEHGFKAAFLFDHQINKGKMNSLRISRLIVDDSTPMWKMKLILSGWHARVLPLTRSLGKLVKRTRVFRY